MKDVFHLFSTIYVRMTYDGKYPFKYITHVHFYQLKKYNVGANLDASYKVISGNEHSSKSKTGMS